MYVYVVLAIDQWRAFQASGRTGELPPDDDERPLAAPWLRRRVAERAGLPEADVRPTYAWVRRPPSGWMWPPKRAVLKVRVPEGAAVLFDDDGYVHVLNTLGNGFTFGAGEGEPEAMFDVGDTAPEALRAFVAPRITLEMVKKVWVYRWGARLRRR